MITLQLAPGSGLDQVGFATSSLFEAVLSLRVLQHPNKHSLLLPWVRRCRHLSDGLRADLRRVSPFVFDRWIPAIFEVGIGRPLTDFDESLEAVTRLGDELIVRELTVGPAVAAGLEPRYDVDDHDQRDRILIAARAQDEDLATWLEDVYADPRSVLHTLLDVLQRYWEEAFAEEWQRIEPQLQQETDRAAQLLATRGIGAVFSGLIPEIRVSPDGRDLTLDKPCVYHDDRVAVAERGGLTLVPSVYAWPSVLVELDRDWPLFVSYPVAELQQAVGHLDRHEVVDTLRALADDTRLTILRLVGEQPRSTKELAGLLQLSEPAVSRHLKQLANVGLLDSRRDGYYVLYELRRDRLSKVGPSVGATLDLDLEPSPVLPVDSPPRPVVVAREG